MQDSTGSVTVDGEHPEEIPMDQMEQEYQPTLIENLVYFLENLLQIIIRVSYLGTNIIMMAWSITFISWLTFVLLIWANIIWLVPNQRKSMLRSSPFLVFYAWFLLISAYVYSMDLTESELPSVIRGINLAQIGFVKVTTLPCNLLLAKCLYTCMFWVTLRQYMQEKLLDRQSSALADMVAPLQLTVGAATTGTTAEPQKKETKVMEVVGNYLKRFLTKFWIWVVAITLFAVAITGQRMTGFRIVYMALFLIFILSFQLSFTIWRKMMFGFWLVIIIFSMLVLILTYTYQFDNFPDYWTDYLHVAKEQQLDIGLEQFETKQLFVRMVTPTFFVIITVVQLHYFHNDFMVLSDPKNTSIINEDEEDDEDLNESSMQGGAAVERSEKDPSSSGYRFEMSEFDSCPREMGDSPAQVPEPPLLVFGNPHGASGVVFRHAAVHLRQMRHVFYPDITNSSVVHSGKTHANIYSLFQFHPGVSIFIGQNAVSDQIYQSGCSQCELYHSKFSEEL
ncbi:hypothetical protein YQE_13087, partial [Dendroctonus ponderosae]